MFSGKTQATLILSLIFCFLINVHGQGTTGDIEGQITDINGALLPGAVVKVESTGTTAGFRRTRKTDSDGYFIFAEVASGTYKVIVSANNFDDFSKNVEVKVDRSETVNVRLKPTGIVAQVEVPSDSSVTIDVTDSKIDTNIPQKVFEAIPKGTNFSTLLKISPNVRPEALGGGFQIDGASGAENVFVIDGQEVTNLRTGTLNSNNDLPFELLQEIQIKSNGFEAEYGGAIGGIINAVTTGGNNDWHGQFGIAFRPGSLQGRPNLGDGGSSGDFGALSNAGFEQNRTFRPNKDGGTHFFPLASLSGPILKDRLWGFFTYAPQIREVRRFMDYYSSPDPAVRTITVSEQYDAKQVSQYAFGRIDAQPIGSLRIFSTFLWNPIYQNGELPKFREGLVFDTPQFSTAQYATRGGRQNSNSFNTQATWTPLNRMVVNFRAGRSFLNEKLGSYGRTADTRFAVSRTSPLDPCDFIPGRNDQCREFNTGSNNLILFDISTRTTMDADVSLVGINGFGRHNIKAGWQLNRLFNDVDSGYASSGYVLLYFGEQVNLTRFTGLPSLPFCDLQNFDPNATNCTLGTARIVRIATFGKAASNNFAIFAQDSWTIKNRVTINYGLRAESEVIPSFLDSATTVDINFGWDSKIAPRLGMAFDLFGNGRTKLFSNYGWFYDRFKYELPRGFLGGNIFMDAFAQIIPARGLTPFGYTLEAMLGGRGVIRGGECPITSGSTGYVECEFDRRVPANSVNAIPFSAFGAVDPNLETMRQSGFTFGVEQELGKNFVLSARFTHKQLDQAIDDIGTFSNQGSEVYVIGNPGQGLACEIPGTVNLPCPDEERKYDALEISLNKRAKDYFFNVNYTWSRLFGNYSGLVNSDEFGRTNPNVNRSFDLPILGWTANGEPDNGLLATDRTHVFKAFGSYSFNWKNGTQETAFSAFTTIQSGTPLTTIYSLLGVKVSILYGRGDLGRTDTFSETDFAVRHKYRFGRDNRFTFEPYLEIRNIFDERNEIARQTQIGRYNILDEDLRFYGCNTCTDRFGVFDTIFNHGGIEQFVLAFLDEPSNRRLDYNQPLIFQAPRDVRFGFRLRF